jgi:uncharacterized protein YjhX (UPF0386 family)
MKRKGSVKVQILALQTSELDEMNAQLHGTAALHMRKEPSVTREGWMYPGNDLNVMANRMKTKQGIICMIQVYSHFGGTYCITLQGRRVSKQANK